MQDFNTLTGKLAGKILKSDVDDYRFGCRQGLGLHSGIILARW